MTINLQKPDITELKPKITVFGVGGGGGNASAVAVDVETSTDYNKIGTLGDYSSAVVAQSIGGSGGLGGVNVGGGLNITGKYGFGLSKI